MISTLALHSVGFQAGRSSNGSSVRTTSTAPAESFHATTRTEDPSARMRSASTSAAAPAAAAERRPAIQNPVVGKASAAPTLVAGPLESPQFLPDEASYFSNLAQLLKDAQPGDIVGFQMYEFESGLTNGLHDAPTEAPGFADQQQILPLMEAAAKRGVKLQGILDASMNKETHQMNNQPIVDWMQKLGEQTGNVTLDMYPPEVVNIDHAKQIFLARPTGQPNTYAVIKAMGGGSNWGNHTPANDDGGGLFFGRDALGNAQIFFRDQAFCRGDRTTPALPQQDANNPVQWAVTAPTAEGGGSTSIRDNKMAAIAQSDHVYLDQFVLNHHGLIAALMDHDPHARVDPNEEMVNKPGLQQLRQAGHEAMWANTAMDPVHFPAQKNHEKIEAYVKGNVAFLVDLGSANDSSSGLDTTHTSPSPSSGKPVEHKTNHEIDAFVKRVNTGEKTASGATYSTEAFCDALLAKIKNDLATRSLQDPPSNLSSTAPGHF
jgi:hypothetical protein